MPQATETQQGKEETSDGLSGIERHISDISRQWREKVTDVRKTHSMDEEDWTWAVTVAAQEHAKKV